MEPMFPPQKVRDLARILVSSEAGAGTTSPQPGLAAVRAYDRLRQQLGAPVGVEGFQALASRALALARSESPRLGTVWITANGDLRGLDEIEAQAEEKGEAGIILIAQLLGLFLTFLGEATTLRLIEDLRLQVGGMSGSAMIAGDSAADEAARAAVFEDLLLEVDRLRSVSEHIQTLADRHPGMEEAYECGWQPSQYRDGFGRFHADSKQSRGVARRTGPTDESLYQLSPANCPSRSEPLDLWIWMKMLDSELVCGKMLSSPGLRV